MGRVMHTEILTYEADGLRMESHLFVDPAQSGRRPGVLVFPEAFGLGDHAKERARRLAGLGYAALACDLYGEGRFMADREQMMALFGPLREAPERIRARAGGGLEALLGRDEVDPARIASIGYCFGGTMSLELARGGAPIAGVVGFHSGLATGRPQDAKDIRARILVLIGADDPGIPPEQRAAFEAEMRAGKVDWQMKLYGGVVHSFTNKDADAMGMPDFARYDAAADRRSWDEMIAFFGEIFGKAA
ncbi:dienelactone hydrolase family protein [Rhizorhabdus wittichii]|uniref:Dienelactone hydrolase family protein n=2 Tax=Rhizorhabdus wittichii TaxID=160791 RepID=A0A975D4N0_9SPHN|nr:dienelactone hydrolase family protein [Rhizorhabdus wittichii]